MQQIVDQESLLDIAKKSEVIDINKKHHRTLIFESIDRLADQEREANEYKDVKYSVRKTTLR